MERIVLRGLLYVALTSAVISLVFPGPSDPAAAGTIRFYAMAFGFAAVAALAISAPAGSATKPATERRPAADAARPEAGAALRRNS